MAGAKSKSRVCERRMRPEGAGSTDNARLGAAVRRSRRRPGEPAQPGDDRRAETGGGRDRGRSGAASEGGRALIRRLRRHLLPRGGRRDWPSSGRQVSSSLVKPWRRHSHYESMACGASRATLAIGEPSSPGGASRRLRFIRAPAPRSGGRPGRVGALGSRIASFGALRLAVETTKEWDSMYSVKQKEIPAFGGVGAFQRSPCAQPCRSVGGRSASEVDIEAKAVGPIDAVCGDCWSR